MMSEGHRRTLALWIGLTTLGFTLGGVIAGVVGSALIVMMFQVLATRIDPTVAVLLSRLVGGIALGAGLGSSLAIAQQRTLSRLLPTVRHWILANAVAYAVATIIFLSSIPNPLLAVLASLPSVIGVSGGDALNGVVVGIFEGAALRRGVRDALAWIGAQVLATVIGGIILRTTLTLVHPAAGAVTFLAEQVTQMLLYGVLLGIATAILLLRWRRFERRTDGVG